MSEDHASSSGFAQPLHPSSFWAEQTKNFDFSEEDKLDAQAFNEILWKGLKGENTAYPTERDGKDLSKHRSKILHNAKTCRQAAKDCSGSYIGWRLKSSVETCLMTNVISR